MGKYLVTGVAGFIGFHLCKALLERGDEVVGVDNLNDYYSVQLKRDRIAQVADRPRFSFCRIDLADRDAIDALFRQHRFTVVLNMAGRTSCGRCGCWGARSRRRGRCRPGSGGLPGSLCRGRFIPGGPVWP